MGWFHIKMGPVANKRRFPQYSAIYGKYVPERLLELADEARISFYTNPKYLWKMFVQSLFSFKEFQRMLIAGRSFSYSWAKFYKRLKTSQR